MAHQVSKLTQESREIRRQIGFPVEAVGEEVWDKEWERQSVEWRAVRRAQTLTEFQGRLIPIGEPDCAKSPPVREVRIIDLTGEPEVIGLTGGPVVIDLSGEEEEHVLEEIVRNVIKILLFSPNFFYSTKL